jgi:hypothetical protein
LVHIQITLELLFSCRVLNAGSSLSAALLPDSIWFQLKDENPETVATPPVHHLTSTVQLLSLPEQFAGYQAPGNLYAVDEK